MPATNAIVAVELTVTRRRRPVPAFRRSPTRGADGDLVARRAEYLTFDKTDDKAVLIARNEWLSGERVAAGHMKGWPTGADAGATRIVARDSPRS